MSPPATQTSGEKSTIGLWASRAAVGAVAVLLVSALVVYRHLITWKLAVTVAALSFGFGEAVVDLVREMTSDSGSGAGTASSSATAAAAADAVGTQRRTVGIEDSATQEMIAQLDRFEWKVDLKIERARKLRVADVTWMGASGSSDPYVKIELGDQIRKTKTVKKNLNPSWNQYYEFGVGKAYGAGLTDKVRLTVYDADVASRDDELGYVELPLWRMVQPHHFEYSQNPEDLSMPQTATRPEHLEAQWYALTLMRRGGTEQLTEQQIRVALQLRIVPPPLSSSGLPLPLEATTVSRAGAFGSPTRDTAATAAAAAAAALGGASRGLLLESSPNSPAADRRAGAAGPRLGAMNSLLKVKAAAGGGADGSDGSTGGLNPIARSQRNRSPSGAGDESGSSLAGINAHENHGSGRGSGRTSIVVGEGGAGGTVAPQLVAGSGHYGSGSTAAAVGLSGRGGGGGGMISSHSPAKHPKAGGSSLPVVEENAGSVTYFGGDSSGGLHETYGMAAADSDGLEAIAGDSSSDMWEDVSDTSSVSSTGSNYSNGHVGEIQSGGGLDSPMSAAHAYSQQHQQHPDMGDVVVPRPLTRDSLRGGNVMLTVTINELFGSGRDKASLRKKLEAEWYVKLRLMKPQGRGFVLVDKPFRTEFQRALPKGQKGAQGAQSATDDDAVPINMQFKFGRAADKYQIDEQLLQDGVLRFKLKVKKFLKFRTMVKSNNVPLRAFLDQSEVGGVSNGAHEQDVKLFDGSKPRAQLRIVLKCSSRT